MAPRGTTTTTTSVERRQQSDDDDDDDAPTTKKQLESIWVITTGSRGDVQPFIPVCVALQKRGYQVKLFTSAEFIDFAQSFGVDAIAMRRSNDELTLGTDDPNELAKLREQFDKENKRWQDQHAVFKGMANGDALTLLRGLRQVNEQSAPLTQRVIQQAIDEFGAPDLVTMTVTTRGVAIYLALEYNVPFVQLGCQDLIYNPQRMSFGLPTLPFGLHYYLIHYILIPMEYTLHEPYIAYANKNLVRNQVLPHITLFSHYLSKILYPTQNPELHRFVGTTVIDPSAQCTHLDSFGGADGKKRLEDFIHRQPYSNRKPIIYLGWGSMLSRSREFMMELCVRSIHHAQCRAVVGGGVSGLSLEMLLHQNKTTNVEPAIVDYARSNILFVPAAPHEWLFPQMAATVHHGGAGTTTAALRAGVPTVVTPVFVDQFDHAYLVDRLGVGYGFARSLPKITCQALGDVIRDVITDTDVAERAAALGKRLRDEDGAEGAVEEIASYWERYCVTGRFHEVFTAREEDEDDAAFVPLRVGRQTSLVLGMALAGVVMAVAVFACIPTVRR